MIDKEETPEASLNNKSYISIEEKSPVNSFKEVKYKDKNIIRFNILDRLLR